MTYSENFVCGLEFCRRIFGIIKYTQNLEYSLRFANYTLFILKGSWLFRNMSCYAETVIPASNEPSDCLQAIGDCREGQI